MVAASHIASISICSLSYPGFAGIQYLRGGSFLRVSAARLVHLGHWTSTVDLLFLLSGLETNRVDCHDPPHFIFFVWTYLSFAERSRGRRVLFISTPNISSHLDHSDCFGDLVGLTALNGYHVDPLYAECRWFIFVDLTDRSTGLFFCTE